MINKNKFSIRNTKKVLHKVGKQWVVVSAVLLGLVAGGAAVNATANADTTAQVAQPKAAVQAPSSAANNSNSAVARPALGATQAASANEARLGGLQGKKAAAKADARKLVNKGLVHDAEAAVNEYIKPDSNQTTHNNAVNAYNTLINDANINNVKHFVNGASLGSNTNDSNANDWIGAFNIAHSAASAINANNPSAHLKVSSYLNKDVYGQNVSASMNGVPASTLGDKTTFTWDYTYPANIAGDSKLKQSVYTTLNSEIGSSLASNSLLNTPVNLSDFGLNQKSINRQISLLNRELSKFGKSIKPINFTKLGTKLGTYGDYLNITPTIKGSMTLTGDINAAIGTKDSKGIHYGDTVGDMINNGVPLIVNGGHMDKVVSIGLSTGINKQALGNMEALINAAISPLTNTLKSISGNSAFNSSLVPNSDKVLVNSLLGKLNNLDTTITNKVNSKLPNSSSSDYQNALASLHKAFNDESQGMSNTAIRLPVSYFGDHYSIDDIANVLDGNGINAGKLSAIKYGVYSKANSLVNAKLGTKDATKAAAVLRGVEDIASHPQMESDYTNILGALKFLPTNEASALQTLSDNSNDLANQFERGNHPITLDTQYNQSIINYLLNIAANTGKAAKSDNGGTSPEALSTDTINYYYDNGDVNTIYITGTQGSNITGNNLNEINQYYTPSNDDIVRGTLPNRYDGKTYNIYFTKKGTPAHNNTNNNGTNSNNNNQNNASTNTNNGTNVPYIAPNNFASSVAAHMNSNSASAQPSTSASANSSVAPEKHADNYAKVIKTLQLHTNPNFTKKNAVAVVKPGTAFKIEKSVKARNGALRYEVRYNKKNYFITANKRWVNAYYKAAKRANYSVNNYVHYRYAQVTKALQLHTSAKFTKRNGVKVVRPGVEFHINHIVKNHGLVRYEVRYNHKNYFITANHHYTVNAYVQKYNFRKHGYKAVRVIKPVNEYRKLSFAKRSLIRHFYRGSILPVKKVVTIASGEMTRLQLTNGRYVSANKDFVEPIR